MARLLVDGEWFDPLPPHAMQAAEYAGMVLDSAAKLYPDYIPVACDIPVRNPRGNALAQLALIAAAYRDWWLVVLETGPSPTADLAIKQVQALRAAKYSEFPKALAQRNGALELEKLSNLMKRDAPRVFLLLSRPPAPPIKDDNACVGIAEIFEHTGTHKRILRINGEHPSAPPEQLTFCSRDAMVPAILLELEQPDKVPPWENDEAVIEIGDVATTWRRMSSMIMAVGPCSLPAGTARFRLVRTPSGRLRILAA